MNLFMATAMIVISCSPKVLAPSSPECKLIRRAIMLGRYSAALRTCYLPYCSRALTVVAKDLSLSGNFLSASAEIT